LRWKETSFCFFKAWVKGFHELVRDNTIIPVIPCHTSQAKMHTGWTRSGPLIWQKWKCVFQLRADVFKFSFSFFCKFSLLFGLYAHLLQIKNQLL
jgi:hypothetical protein